MPGLSEIRAAVIGTGFIGTVHLEALRRIGVSISGVLGSSPERGADRAAVLGVDHAYRDLAELAADPLVDVVHVTSPTTPMPLRRGRSWRPASTSSARSPWR